MNKRQTEKHYKRKWRQLLADVFNDKLNIRVKPSRIKTYIRKSEHAVLVGGIANGYILELNSRRRREKMSAAKKCDRCKEFYEPFNPGRYIVEGSKGAGDKIVDLCPNCADTLKKWLKGDVQMIVFTGDEEAADEPEQAAE